MIDLTRVTRRKRKDILLIGGLIISILCVSMYSTYKSNTVQTFGGNINKKVVYIDAGHGGFDPGVVVGSTYEKDINLEIALKLQAQLQQTGAIVYLSRATDEAMAETKKGDMNARKELPNNESIDIVVSIHQNSYPKASIKGVQVFYYDGEQSKQLANSIESQLVKLLGDDNVRESKVGDYYMLEQTKVPAVIVECGFVSNSEDFANLQSEEYQKKLAYGIFLGINEYFGGGGK